MKYEISNRIRSLIPTNNPLPNFIIIGAQRSGTTTLFDYLSRHPDANPSKSKEIHFFDLNYRYGKNWYRYNFPNPGDNNRLFTFESSPYYIFHPAVPERIKIMLPTCKFIVMLRNPVNRAYSHYWHERKHGRENLSFIDAIVAENDRLKGEEELLLENDKYVSEKHRRFSYFSRGCYAKQIERWYSYFSRDDFLFIESEEFFNNSFSVMHQINEFLGIDDYMDFSFTHRNKGNYVIPVDESLKAELSELNRNLEELTGIKFSWQT